MVQTKTAPYDSAEFLNSPKAVQFYMEEAMESGDPQLITHALGVVARAKSMSDIARKSGLSRESLYRSLSPTGKPEFGTIMSVLKALKARKHQVMVLQVLDPRERDLDYELHVHQHRCHQCSA